MVAISNHASQDGAVSPLRMTNLSRNSRSIARHVARLEDNAIVEDISCSEGRED